MSKKLLLMFVLALGLIGGLVQAQTKPKKSVAEPALRRELLDRMEQDQKIRDEWIKQGVNNPNEALQKRWQQIDDANATRMREIIKQYGWPGPELVGKDGTNAAFLLVQHADHAFQKEVLPLVKAAYQAGKLEGQSYALLLDRVLVRDGKPQIYGTQAEPLEKWKDDEATLQPIEDEANVDKRRQEVGLPPLAEYKKVLKEVYFPKTKKQ